MNEFVFNGFLEKCDKHVSLGRFVAFLNFDARFFGRRPCLFVGCPVVVIDAGKFLDRFNHGEPFPRLAHIYFCALIGDVGGAANLFCEGAIHILYKVHHILVVAVRLIHFDGGEFRVVASVHTFVSEDTADLVNLAETADDEAFEVKLGFDPKEHIDAECVVEGFERSCGSADFKRLQNRGVHLEIAEIIQISSDAGENFASRHKRVLNLRICNEVQFSLTISGVLVF